MDDAARLLDWRNESSARSASFQSHSVSWPEHEAWLSRTLADNQVDLWIVELEDEAVGQMRFNFDSGGDEATISISLAPEFRKRGWGTTIIEAACRKTFHNRDIESISALVKPANSASVRAFERAGFADLTSLAIHGQSAKRLVLGREQAGDTSKRELPWRKSV